MEKDDAVFLNRCRRTLEKDSQGQLEYRTKISPLLRRLLLTENNINLKFL